MSAMEQELELQLAVIAEIASHAAPAGELAGHQLLGQPGASAPLDDARHRPHARRLRRRPPGRENFYRHGIGAAPDAGLEFRDY